MAAIIIRRSIAGRNIDQTQFFVSAHGCPTVGRAACQLLAFRRHYVEVRSPRIESPGKSSSDGILGADHAGWFAAMLSVRYPSAPYYLASHSCWRGGEDTLTFIPNALALKHSHLPVTSNQIRKGK